MYAIRLNVLHRGGTGFAPETLQTRECDYRSDAERVVDDFQWEVSRGERWQSEEIGSCWRASYVDPILRVEYEITVSRSDDHRPTQRRDLFAGAAD
jgi:hypothetical protein